MSIYNIPDWFEWGELAPHRDQIWWEIFSLGVYDQYRLVKTHDVVVDIGASVAPFSYTAGLKNPSKIIMVEPSKNLLRTATKNMSEFMTGKNPNPCVFVNAAIGSSSDQNLSTQNTEHTIYGNESNFHQMTFSQLVRDYQIDHIDFLKIDCEGGEYDIITDENLDFLKNHVSFIACEVHSRFITNGPEKFQKLRQLLLDNFDNYHLTISWQHKYLHVDIRPMIHNAAFMDYIISTQEMMLYIINK